MPIIVMIGIITIFSFHYSFFSDSSLEVDFSLEQMFPENDPEKNAYDSFINEFSREDDKILIMYDGVNPTSRESIVALSKLTEAFN